MDKQACMYNIVDFSHLISSVEFLKNSPKTFFFFFQLDLKCTQRFLELWGRKHPADFSSAGQSLHLPLAAAGRPCRPLQCSITLSRQTSVAKIFITGTEW